MNFISKLPITKKGNYILKNNGGVIFESLTLDEELEDHIINSCNNYIEAIKLLEEVLPTIRDREIKVKVYNFLNKKT